MFERVLLLQELLVQPGVKVNYSGGGEQECPSVLHVLALANHNSRKEICEMLVSTVQPKSKNYPYLRKSCFLTVPPDCIFRVRT